MFTIIHQSVERKSTEFRETMGRNNYVTPTSFLELLNAYANILTTKRKEVSFSKNRLVGGLKVLEEAGIEIAGLEKEIAEMTPELEKT